MKRELKKLFNYLKNYSRENRGFFGTDMEWIVLYLFLRRYDDIKEDFGLPHFGYDLSNSLEGNVKIFYPHDDLVKPFYKFLSEKNEGIFDNIDLDSYFKREESISALAPNEIHTLNRAIKQSEISDFKIQTFSVNEFDSFFTDLIELTKDRSEKSIYRRILNKEFAKFISDHSPEKKISLYYGDETGELMFQAQDDKIKRILVGSYDSVLWYYLRVILSGKINVEVRINELFSLVNDSADFLFIHPPSGILSKNFFNQFGGNYDANNLPKHWEALYLQFSKGILKQKGKAFVLLPSSFLHKNNRDFKKLRKELTDKKCVQSIIKFPKGLFSPLSSVNYSLFELDFSREWNQVKFIDSTEIKKLISPRDTDTLRTFFTEVSHQWKESIGFYPLVKNVETNEIRNADYSWAFSNYFSVANEPDKYIRSREEQLLPLTEVLKPIRLKSAENLNDINVIGISHLAENIASFKIKLDALPLVKNSKRVKKLEQSAILIGKIIGSIKPSYFEYNGKEVYLKPSVVPFEVSEGFDVHYMIQELRSDFVLEQFRKAESASTIPSYSNRILSNIFLRVPPLHRQREIVKEELSELARSKVEEIHKISKEMRVVEREYLSGFKHDFMQIMGNLSSGINNIETFLQQKADDGIIKFSEPIIPYLPGEKIDSENTVKKTLNRVQANLNTAIEFLEIEMTRMVSGLHQQNFQTLDINSFINEWKTHTAKKDNFEIKVGKSEDWPKSKSIKVILVPTLMKTLLRNLLNNADRHGFNDSKLKYEFWIHLGLVEENDQVYVKLLIYNNGLPFEEKYTFEDFVKARTSAGKNRGTGLGGAQILRLAEEMNMIFREPAYPVNQELYPVQFELLIPIVEENE